MPSSNEFKQYLWCSSIGEVHSIPVESQLPPRAIITELTLEAHPDVRVAYRLQHGDRLIILYSYPRRFFADFVREGQPVPWAGPARLVAIIKGENNRVYMVDDRLTDEVQAEVRHGYLLEETRAGQILKAMVIAGAYYCRPFHSIWQEQ